MMRIAAILCFTLTLLCPVFCLAEAGGDCPDRGRQDAQNCEAMAVGAVVARSVLDTTPLCLSLLSIERFLAAAPPAAGRGDRAWATAWNRVHSRPPSASLRQAFLQIFLF